MRIYRNLIFWILIVFIFGIYYTSKKSVEMPNHSEINHSLYKDPLQTPCSIAPFTVHGDNYDWRIEPKFNYELFGVVVSYNDSDSFADYTHKQWGDQQFNIRDLGVIWGPNIVSDSYGKMEYSSKSFTLYAKAPTHAIWLLYSMNNTSNNHVITEDAALQELVRSVEVGDQIYLKGYLCKYSNNNGFRRGTSVTRTDRGNGACETIYLNDFVILKKANELWRLINSCLWLSLIVLIPLFLYLVLNTPIKLNF